jgi:hypothetical protein
MRYEIDGLRLNSRSIRTLPQMLKLIIAITILLSSCSYVKTVEDYRTVLTSKLCVDYLSAGWAFNTKPMEQALNERGEDCKEYVGAAERRRAERARRSDNAARELRRMSDQLRKEGGTWGRLVYQGINHAI